MTKQSKTILITGATAGIGRHAALYLAKKGHRVFATGRRAEALASLEQQARGFSLQTLELDVTDAASIAAAVDAVAQVTEGRGVDVLVNNAGYGQIGPLESVSTEQLRAQFETNVFGLMAVTRAFLPAMRQRRQGRVINISSVAGRMSMPFMGAYTATKFAVEAMSDALRAELAPFGVQVVLIEPGVIRSEFSQRAEATLAASADIDDYTPFVARLDDVKKRMEKTAVGPQCISSAIERAIVARRPRARYIAPKRASALLAINWLPTRGRDWLMRSVAGLRAI